VIGQIRVKEAEADLRHRVVEVVVVAGAVQEAIPDRDRDHHHPIAEAAAAENVAHLRRTEEEVGTGTGLEVIADLAVVHLHHVGVNMIEEDLHVVDGDPLRAVFIVVVEVAMMIEEGTMIDVVEMTVEATIDFVEMKDHHELEEEGIEEAPDMA